MQKLGAKTFISVKFWSKSKILALGNLLLSVGMWSKKCNFLHLFINQRRRADLTVASCEEGTLF